jgi:hypothetical protein
LSGAERKAGPEAENWWTHVSAQEVRSLLTARKLMQAKLLGIECSIRDVLRGFRLKVGSGERDADADGALLQPQGLGDGGRQASWH